jgi:hypothetical protein
MIFTCPLSRRGEGGGRHPVVERRKSIAYFVQQSIMDCKMYCTKKAHVRIIVGRGASTLQLVVVRARHTWVRQNWVRHSGVRGCDTTGCGYNWVRLQPGAVAKGCSY